jgi:uncharacterized cofD-like protein
VNWALWFIPGLRVKRWVALFLFGVALLVLGVGQMAGGHQRLAGWLTGAAGLVLVLLSARGFLNSLLSDLLPHQDKDFAQSVLRLRMRARGPKIAVLGGGTGMPVLLRGLKQYSSNITAIVTSADDGGSSGRLRNELGVLPPGDVRNCLLALSEAEPQLAQLFQYRFETGEGLAGHAFGNLFLAALERITGDFEAAVLASSRVLAVTGQVLPATVGPATLVAETESGEEVRGESTIGRAGLRPRRMYLDPPDVRASKVAVQAIAEADAVVLAPGSLYTSVLPPLLVPELRAALLDTRAIKVYVQNLMTQPGETDGFTASQHLEELERLVGVPVAEWVIANSAPLPADVLERYARQGSHPVVVDAGRILAKGYRLLAEPLAAADRFVRHDERRLARAVLSVVLRRPPKDARRRLDYFFLAERLRQEAKEA